MSLADDIGPDGGGDELIAAEYVLGVLPADERQIAARRIGADRDFARLVETWEVRLSPMDAAYSPVEAPASAKAGIDRRLFSGATAAALGGLQSARSLWSSLAVWRGLAVSALAGLAIYVAIPYVNPPAVEPPLRLVASLAPRDSDVHYFVVYDARTRDVGLSHVTGARAEGRDFELWVIEGQQAPASLGIIPAGSNVHLAVSDAISDKIESGAVFAISMEPAGGSPTGQPTGPVVAAGDLKSI
jgi:anti-sigma-K factor RskA